MRQQRLVAVAVVVVAVAVGSIRHTRLAFGEERTYEQTDTRAHSLTHRHTNTLPVHCLAG